MPSMMAIISKSVFEQMTKGTNPAPGSVVATDRYTSNSPRLEPLKQGGTLFLVTVRPPKEDLWLVAVLDAPQAKAGAWVAKMNTAPVVNINDVKPKLKFDSGTGIQAKAGALAMSLQTPRVLTANDVTLLRTAAGLNAGASAGASATAGASASAKKPAGKVAPSKPREIDALDAWTRMTPTRLARLVHQLIAKTNGAVAHVRTHAIHGVSVPVLVHRATGATFHLMPGGTVTVGMTDDDAKAVRAQLQGRADARRGEIVLNDAVMRPARTVRVPAFAMAERPFSGEELSRLLSRGRRTASVDTRALRGMTTEAYLARKGTLPGTVNAAMLAGLESMLAECGMRLPSEVEWEFAARAGAGVFCTGATIPADTSAGVRNAYGIADLGVDPEACADQWHEAYERAPDHARPWRDRGADGVRAVRGGAARVQSGASEPAWARMLCAARSASTRFADAIAIRPVITLE